MEYCSAIKMKEVMIHATIWKNPENILNEARHKDHILYDPILRKIPNREIYMDRK